MHHSRDYQSRSAEERDFRVLQGAHDGVELEIRVHVEVDGVVPRRHIAGTHADVHLVPSGLEFASQQAVRPTVVGGRERRDDAVPGTTGRVHGFGDVHDIDESGHTRRESFLSVPTSAHFSSRVGGCLTSVCGASILNMNTLTSSSTL
jgi:hypothetical protein